MKRSAAETELYQRFFDLASSAIQPKVRQNDTEHRFDREAWQAVGAAGFFRLPVRRELGGLGHGLHAYAAALEGLAEGSGDLGFSVSVVAHLVCLMALEQFGSAEQHRLYLPRLLSGVWIGAVANAEPQAGTNLMALASEVHSSRDGFELTSEKQSITNVGVADLAMCSARWKDVPVHKEVNIFLVETATPGVQTRIITNLAGLRSSCTGDLRAEQAYLPGHSLLGGVGQGLKIFQFMFAQERLFTGALYLSALRACLQRGLEHAETRLQFGSPIGRNQYVQDKVVRTSVAAQLLASLLDHLLTAVEQGEDVSEQLTIVKVHGIEAALTASQDLMRLLGGRGMSQQELAEKYHRDLLALSVLGGTVELQKIVIYQELSRQLTRRSAGGTPSRTGVVITVHDVKELDETLERSLVELTARLFPDEPALAGRFYYDSRPDLVVAAWKDGTLIGFRMVVRRLVGLNPGKLRVAGLGIGVDPRFQRQGIGTELTRRTLEVLREHHDELALAFLFTPVAEPLLRSFGFRLLSARVTYCKRDTGELVVESMPAYALDLGQGTLVDDLNARGSMHLGVGSW